MFYFCIYTLYFTSDVKLMKLKSLVKLGSTFTGDGRKQVFPIERIIYFMYRFWFFKKKSLKDLHTNP